jgi:hypothetical protein
VHLKGLAFDFFSKSCRVQDFFSFDSLPLLLLWLWLWLLLVVVVVVFHWLVLTTSLPPALSAALNERRSDRIHLACLMSSSFSW